jgi:predicted nucleotidyltransferase
MKSTLLARLAEIEATYNVVIFYACESGSRAWGFPSVDSDYDVRFLYIHPVEWYLSIDERRNVIEAMDGELDFSGWDIKKALNLFRKPNGPLYEWLGSPIVYLEKYSITSKLRAMEYIYYSPMVLAHHYWHMAQNGAGNYLKDNEFLLKKTFYTLRPLLAIQWLEKGYGVVPTPFQMLVDRLITDQDLKDAIDHLVEVKRHSTEHDRAPRAPIICDFIEHEMTRHETNGIDLEGLDAPLEPLNILFRDALREIRGNL